MGDFVTVSVDLEADGAATRRLLRDNHAYRSWFTFAVTPAAKGLIESQFAKWLRERKNIDAGLDKAGVFKFGNRSLTVLHNDKRGAHQARFTLKEKRGHQIWQTELTIWLPQHEDRGWANLTVGSNTGTPAAPPHLYANLVDVLDDVRDGALPLSSEPPVVAAAQCGEVLDWIADSDRHALLFVAGTAQDLDFSAWVAKVREWTYGMRGMGQAIILDPIATEELAAALGHSHEVMPWTIRTFRPGATLGVRADGLQHRILGWRRLAYDTDVDIRKLLTGVARVRANARPTPSALARTTRDLDRIGSALLLDRIFTEPASRLQVDPSPVALAGCSADTTAKFSPIAEEAQSAESEAMAQLRERVHEQQRLLQAIEDSVGAGWSIELLNEAVAAMSSLPALRQDLERQRTVLTRSRDELRESLTEADDLRDHLEKLRGEMHSEEEARTLAELERVEAEDEARWLRGELKKLQAFDVADARMPAELATNVPLTFEDLCERLSELEPQGVVFTGDLSTVRDLSGIDPNGKFAVAAWEALLALCSFREARRAGDFSENFKMYLDNTPAGYRQLSPGKHSPTESEPTMQKYGHLRVFPVPQDADPSGKAAMPAHFRLGKAGMSSPRMHYYDAVSVNECIYVGYVGPHLRTVSTN
jgi:flagellar biosynthesis chaperone FliJ